MQSSYWQSNLIHDLFSKLENLVESINVAISVILTFVHF